VIHTVGPVWTGGGLGEDALLESCYRQSLALARQHDLHSIAFPAISTGVYRFPLQRATEIAVSTTADELQTTPGLAVTFCCFSDDALAAYRTVLAQHDAA
jgi:O-acetyl-ADP-ribose deacetylase (regulator of RNase III)